MLAVDQDATVVTVSPAGPLVANNVDEFTIAVTLRNNLDQPLGSRTVDLSLQGTSCTVAPANRVTTAADGTAHWRITAALGGDRVVTLVVDADEAPVTLEEHPTLSFLSNQPALLALGTTPVTGTAGQPLVAFTVTALDIHSNPVNTTIDLVVASGPTGSSFGAGSTTLEATSNGVATFDNVILETAGAYQLQAKVGSVTSTPFSVSISANVLAILTVAQAPTTGRAGETLGAITLLASDLYGNEVDALVTMTIESGPVTAFDSGTTSRSTTLGSVSFDDLVLQTRGNYQLQAHSGSVWSVAIPITIQANPPTHLFITQGPATGEAGVPLTPSLTVELRDALDNPSTNAMVRVELDNPPPGVDFLNDSVTTKAATNGVVVFDMLRIGVEGAYVFKVTSGTLPSETHPVQISAGPARRMRLSAQPERVYANTPFGAVVHLVDDYQNPARTAGVGITVSIGANPTGASLSGTLLQTTDSNGEVTFNDLRLNKGGGSFTGRFVADMAHPQIQELFTEAFDVQGGPLVISEIHLGSGQAFIELYNNSENPVELGPVLLLSTYPTVLVADIRANNGPLAPFGYAKGVPGNSVPADAWFAYDPGFQLTPTGDSLRIYMGPTDNSVLSDIVDFRDHVTVDTPSPTQFPLATNRSMQLHYTVMDVATNDNGINWCLTFQDTETAGLENQDCTASTEASLVINELYYLPPEGNTNGHAWVELAGPGGGLIGGVVLTGADGSGVPVSSLSVTIPINQRLPVSGIFLVADLDSSIPRTDYPGANLISDTVEPARPDGLVVLQSGSVVLDALAYGLATGGEGTPSSGAIALGCSLARDAVSWDTDDNNTDFTSVDTPTPGYGN